ncbi:MAG: tRNA glutamyl-Q(34) synthetase GluQRS [Caulobacteraceae bacterium]
MTVAAFVTRFAPSPTGALHLGHVFSALTAFDAARAAGGRFLLRIEDIDASRCRPAHEAAAMDDLAWLGLEWETPVRRQSAHLADYRAAIDRLRAEGLLYRCFRTRREVARQIASAPHGPPARSAGGRLSAAEESRRLATGENFAWRLDLEAARRRLGGFDRLAFVEAGAGPRGESGATIADPTAAGDVVLGRKGVGVAYHLAVVVDDALQGVTQVIRGNDLFDSVPIQRLLQALLGLPTPIYRHHRLLAGADGKRLAKRDGAQSLAALRADGVTAADARARVGL